MSKELEAFELLCRFLVEEINALRHKDINEDYFYNEKYGVTMTDKKTGIEYTTSDITKALKVLEIIKDKSVNVYWFRYVQKHYKGKELKIYNSGVTVERRLEVYNGGVKVAKILTQEEYDLLKEVLK